MRKVGSWNCCCDGDYPFGPGCPWPKTGPKKGTIRWTADKLDPDQCADYIDHFGPSTVEYKITACQFDKDFAFVLKRDKKDPQLYVCDEFDVFAVTRIATERGIFPKPPVTTTARYTAIIQIKCAARVASVKLILTSYISNFGPDGFPLGESTGVLRPNAAHTRVSGTIPGIMSHRSGKPASTARVVITW
jgi:hypothetical protein